MNGPKTIVYLLMILVIGSCNDLATETGPPKLDPSPYAKNYEAAHSKTDVYAWGRTTVEALKATYPDSFGNAVENAILPTDYDFSQFDLEFDQSISTDLYFSQADAEFLRDAGIICVIAEACGLGWNNDSFLPMMQWQRRFLPPEIRRGSYQITTTGVRHGFAMGRMNYWIENNDVKCEVVQEILSENLFSNKFPGY